MDILLRRRTVTDAFQAEIVGTMTTAIVTDEPAGAEFVGVRFHPGEAFRFLAVPAHEATDEVVPLRDVWGAMVTELEAQVSEARNSKARLSAITRVLERRLRGAAPADFRVRRAIAGERVDLGARQLRRIFDHYVGIAPKAFSRIMRLQRAVSMIDAPAQRSWAAVATACGYSDQPHLVREFQALVGLSPAAYARARAMSDSFNPEVAASAMKET